MYDIIAYNYSNKIKFYGQAGKLAYLTKSVDNNIGDQVRFPS